MLDQKLDAIARATAIPEHLVRQMCLLHRKRETSVAFWQAWNRLHAAIGRKEFTLLELGPMQPQQI
ncbi:MULTISPECIES: hypothetical protein [Paraburkholderia]|uniref:Uncharacterized protein n=1 Tax=Paraburkholderia dipogonis TaxID=1211383 RepID=A0A4Y8MH61_9BURK|nr:MULTISPECIES: hypothetical protein [Paraburkholderia]TFE36758.1 hypothetical protein E2553_44680 [Paraburkholderia dipogonis]